MNTTHATPTVERSPAPRAPPPCPRTARAPTETPPLIICTSTSTGRGLFRKQHSCPASPPDIPVIRRAFVLVLRKPRPLSRRHEKHPTARIQRQGDRAWTLTPPRGLPLWSILGERVQYRCGHALRRAARRLGHHPTWAVAVQPTLCSDASILRPSGSSSTGSMTSRLTRPRAQPPDHYAPASKSPLLQADLVFTTSTLLARSRGAHGTGAMHVVPTACARWIERAPVIPEDLRELPRPWIGFMGAVFCYLDFDLLVAAARDFRHGTLVMVGRSRTRPGAAACGRAQRRPARRPRQERVARLRRLFRCVPEPVQAGAVRRAVNPLKIYEYLAAGSRSSRPR